MEQQTNTKSQTTIFIIVAVIIVALIIIIFFLFNPPDIEIKTNTNPYKSIESCTLDVVTKAIETLSPRGGDIEPKEFIRYNDTDRSYLCFTDIYYERCVNERPMLVEHVEYEITNFITPKIIECFETLNYKFSSTYEITEKNIPISVKTKLTPNLVTITINKDMTMRRGDELKEFKDFEIRKVHPLFDLLTVTKKIVNQEARYCDFDDLGYMILYPRFDIKKLERGDSTMIYTVRDNPTGEQFVFATKSCPLPAGM